MPAASQTDLGSGKVDSNGIGATRKCRLRCAPAARGNVQDTRSGANRCAAK
jgi:hypothetical protein